MFKSPTEISGTLYVENKLKNIVWIVPEVFYNNERQKNLRVPLQSHCFLYVWLYRIGVG